jgi:alpha-D-ribose 1-methylphosphonate 5-triphosphate synthase subunit PhnL
MPEVGEQVIYFTNAGSEAATVVRVHMWDLVDLRLADGTEIVHVRRILAMHIGESDVGRFERLVPRVLK